MDLANSVYLAAPGLHCAAGSSLPALWQAMKMGVIARPIDSLGDVWPVRAAYFADEPDLNPNRIDRKLLRTMEKQARLALFGADLSMRGIDGCRSSRNRERFGLYVGLPTVDEDVPPLPLLAELVDIQPGATELALVFLRQTPPFSGLALLNSSTCAHISTTFGLTGAMAAFSPFEDAGLQALIEGTLSILEKENDLALIGAVSPKINPLLLLQHDLRDLPSSVIPGEATAFLVAGREVESPIKLAGYGRGYANNDQEHTYILATVIQSALVMAGIEVGDVDWILAGSTGVAAHNRAQALAFEHCFAKPVNQLPICSVAKSIGLTGPAEPMVHVLLAMHGMVLKQRLVTTEGELGWHEEPAPMRNVLVTACGLHGQLTVIVLTKETM